jgi:integrase
MSPARRSIKRRDWPRGLREPRPGYYSWDHPDGRSLAIGRVPLAVAKNEAMLANQHVAAQRPGLLERIDGGAHTVAQLLELMPVPSNKNTAKSARALDKKIRAAIGARTCSSITTKDCAALIRSAVEKGNARTAQALRSRLIAVCQYGQAEGWLDHNPAEATRRPDVEVKRGRLTLETFHAIRARAAEVAEWLPLAIDLAVTTGADRSTLAALERKDIKGDALLICRSKTKHSTGLVLEIPLGIRLEVLGLELGELLRRRTGVVSPYVLHHVAVYGNAPAGSRIHPDRISHAFTEARKLAGIPDEGAPTFHELRSLCKRLYDKQGNVNKVAMPDFYKLSINTSITCIPGQYVMVGALSPKNEKGEVDRDRKIMIFVKCDILAQSLREKYVVGETELRTLKLLIPHQGRLVPSKGAIILFGR